MIVVTSLSCVATCINEAHLRENLSVPPGSMCMYAYWPNVFNWWPVTCIKMARERFYEPLMVFNSITLTLSSLSNSFWNCKPSNEIPTPYLLNCSVLRVLLNSYTYGYFIVLGACISNWIVDNTLHSFHALEKNLLQNVECWPHAT